MASAQSARSLRTRAVLALLLMVGFYVFALAIAGGLLWVPYAEVTYAERVNARLTLFCIIGGLTILYAIVPRIDKFEAPGPRLTPANAPKLFDMIHDVAKATSQARPEDVYLLSDVNAFVTHRGGMMGFGSRRVMGIGLPLIKGLSPAELRAVIAHEFGHYVSGDVALGPWIHKTRAAIGRTLHHLGNNWLLTTVFAWYARMFMRMTTQISREQEFVADATAARVAGTAPAISALKRVEVIAPAFSTYMNQEVMPVLGAGYLPPVSEGFEKYMNDPDTHQMFQEYAKEVALGAEAGEFDTHPPTAERISALGRIKQPTREGAQASNALLLKDPDRHARALLEHNFGKDTVVKLKAIGWDDVGAKVYAQLWESTTKQHAKWLGTLTADQIPSDKKWFQAKGAELTRENPDATADYKVAFAVHVLTCAVGAALLRRGWTVETAPGRPIVVVKDSERFNPRESISKLAEGALSAGDWKATCDALALPLERLVAGVPN
jgi:heat shock protein HtpX